MFTLLLFLQLNQVKSIFCFKSESERKNKLSRDLVQLTTQALETNLETADG